MAKPLENDKPKIQMLLDIENIFGESTRGLGQFILTLGLCLLPPLFIGYFSLYLFIPWQILVAVCIIWAIRMILIVMGREADRLRNFKAIRVDVYTSTDDMARVRTIHPQGLVEYVTGTVGFFIVTYNDSSENVLQKSKQIDRFINLAVGKHPFDIYIQNINDTKHLTNKYKNVTLFSDSEAAESFMEIIDYNSQVVESTSKLTRNILFIKGSKYQWKDMLGDIQTALHSEAARVFRSAYLVTDEEEIKELISRDVNGYVDLDEMMQRKYRTGNTHNSKVISYDFRDVIEEKEKQKELEDVDITSFIPTMK